ncbi:MAG: hypothetical protein ACT4OO_02675 [Nitrospiraceae bacterium]
MGCLRCGGLTVPELIRDGVVISIAWHCMICGELVDPVIMRNRTRPPQPVSWLDEPKRETEPVVEPATF